MTEDTAVMLNGFGTVVNSLKGRAKPYLPQICGTIKWRLNNKVPPEAALCLRSQLLELLCSRWCRVLMGVGLAFWHSHPFATFLLSVRRRTPRSGSRRRT